MEENRRIAFDLVMLAERSYRLKFDLWDVFDIPESCDADTVCAIINEIGKTLSIIAQVVTHPWAVFDVVPKNRVLYNNDCLYPKIIMKLRDMEPDDFRMTRYIRY